MTYFKGIDRAMYAVYTQHIYCTVVTIELHWLFPILDSTYTEALAVNTPLLGLYGVPMHLCVTTYSPRALSLCCMYVVTTFVLYAPHSTGRGVLTVTTT